MKKVLYTLNINNYEPDITKITFKYMKKYCKKIGAEFVVIDKPKFNLASPAYEKFQIYDLAKKLKADWNIFFDADALIHPDFIDITEVLHKDTTSSFWSDFNLYRYKLDNYFKRDGRFIGHGNWCAIASDWCLDLFKPLDDITVEEAAQNITPLNSERLYGTDGMHLVDDYVVSRNIARYGLKRKTISEIYKERELGQVALFHVYNITAEDKLKQIKDTVKLWSI